MTPSHTIPRYTAHDALIRNGRIEVDFTSATAHGLVDALLSAMSTKIGYVMFLNRVVFGRGKGGHKRANGRVNGDHGRTAVAH